MFKGKFKADVMVHTLYLAIVFLCMYVFFTQVEPIMVCDPDDWTYISYTRSALPMWGAWNPTKIFPETFMGLCGSFAAFIIYPITGEYLGSFTIVYAAIICLFIVVYLYFFDKFIKRCFKLSSYKTIFVSFLFVALHFLMFKSRSDNNVFMFTASNLNCFMNYLVPALLNASLALVFFGENFSEKFREYSLNKLGILLLLIYLSIYSNMVVNVLFLAPVFCSFVAEFITYLKNKSTFIFKDWLSRFFPYIGIFLLEIVCLVFEMNGGRAKDIEFNPKAQVLMIVDDVKSIIGLINRPVFVVTLLVIIIAVLICFLEKKKSEYELIFIRNMFNGLACLSLSILYMLCLYIRIGDHKLVRSENIFIMFLYYAIIVSISTAYILYKVNKTALMIPIVAYIVYFQIFSGGYKGSISYYNYDTKTCENINRNIIEQFVMADESGATEINLILPKDGLGWYDFTGARIAKTLYRHGIVSKEMTVNVVQDQFLE